MLSEVFEKRQTMGTTMKQDFKRTTTTVIALQNLLFGHFFLFNHFSIVLESDCPATI
jgi:hypothetical protein